MEREKPMYYVTCDAAVFAIRDGKLYLLLIRRKNEPFQHMAALPGGYVEEHEDLDEAVRRELMEETGVSRIHLEQIGAFGAPGRDPRDPVSLEAKTDAEEAYWERVDALPALAFDHAKIIEAARTHLCERIWKIAFSFLTQEFTLTELQQVFEAVLGEALDKRNFRKKVLGENLVKETGNIRKGGRHRPAKLYAEA